jgi:hypothetical protein
MSSQRNRVALGALCLPVPPRLAPPHLNENDGKEYLRRAWALYLLGNGASDAEASRRTGVPESTVRHLVMRAVLPDANGIPRGYRACVPTAPGPRRRRVAGMPMAQPPPITTWRRSERRRWQQALLDLVQQGYVELHWPPSSRATAGEVSHA